MPSNFYSSFVYWYFHTRITASVLKKISKYNRNERGNIRIPFSSVVAVGDYVVVAEEDIL